MTWHTRPVSGHSWPSTCHSFRMLTARSQRLLCPRAWSSDDRTHRGMTWRTTTASDHVSLHAPSQGPDVQVSSAPWRQVGYREEPEAPNHDLTRLTRHDWTHLALGPSSAHCMPPWQRTLARPDAPTVRQVTTVHQHPVNTLRLRPSPLWWPDTHVQGQILRLVTVSQWKTPFLYQLLLCKCANTTKCTTTRACVLAFSQTFLRSQSLNSPRHSILTHMQS
jgi:hypothetical protein